jgi:hypothetical protein
MFEYNDSALLMVKVLSSNDVSSVVETQTLDGGYVVRNVRTSELFYPDHERMVTAQSIKDTLRELLSEEQQARSRYVESGEAFMRGMRVAYGHASSMVEKLIPRDEREPEPEPKPFKGPKSKCPACQQVEPYTLCLYHEGFLAGRQATLNMIREIVNLASEL